MAKIVSRALPQNNTVGINSYIVPQTIGIYSVQDLEAKANCFD